MAAHISNGSTNGASANGAASSFSLRDLPKSNVFTSNLPPDSAFPTPKDSHETNRQKLGPRLVKDALYTFVRPETVEEHELLAVSEVAMKDIGIKPGEEETDEFKETMAGNRIISYDTEKHEGVYPWAQCYGGYQFGQWAGQLGDGRAISLFESTNPSTGTRYELQLKGAGKTPYSRFADGKAVVRSSIREFVVSEYLNSLRIPTTRALALTMLPNAQVRRERMEPGAIVCRFAQSWLRIGTFDLMRARGDRKLIRQLATYTAENVFGGWENLPAKLDQPPEDPPASTVFEIAVERGVSKDTVQGDGKDAENRFVRLYREIVRRNAKTVAAWQAYGFMNGVLNTDNTSIFGLSMDFGPFAFMDNFDPSYTPNHDDHMSRYSYRNQPSIIWWNLVRLGEGLGELLGAGAGVDVKEFVEEGVRQDAVDELVERAENIIEKTGTEYKAVFMAEYRRLMTSRMGLKTFKVSDFDELFSEFLDLMEAHELDLNQSFRRLAKIKVSEMENQEARETAAGKLFRRDGNIAGSKDDARQRIGRWLEKYRARAVEDWGEGNDAERQAALRAVNPKFVPKGWVLDEVIERVEKKGDREILKGIMKMGLSPFEEEWGWNKEEEERFCGDVPKFRQGMQCSCSS